MSTNGETIEREEVDQDETPIVLLPEDMEHLLKVFEGPPELLLKVLEAPPEPREVDDDPRPPVPVDSPVAAASAASAQVDAPSEVEAAVARELETARRDASARPRLAVVLGGVAAVLAAALLVAGAGYYRLPTLERPFHDLHGLLRPTGRVGLVLAFAGTGLILLNLTYLVRKNVAAVKRFGLLRKWMGLHVLTGLVGPTLILFHTAFSPYSALGILSLSAMLVVVTTGVIGRYIYAFVPRARDGRELDSEDIKKRLSEYRTRLENLGVPSELLDWSAPDVKGAASTSVFGALLGVVVGERERRRSRREFARLARSHPGFQRHVYLTLPLIGKLCRERQWLVIYQDLRLLMRSWRFFHRWLAILMLVLVAFHIVIGVRFGDLWIFRGSN